MTDLIRDVVVPVFALKVVSDTLSRPRTRVVYVRSRPSRPRVQRRRTIRRTSSYSMYRLI